MPTQRPFLGNFLAAFRVHSQPLSKSTPSISTSAAAASSATIWTATPQQPQKASSPGPETTATSPKPINVKSNPYAQTATAAQERQLVSSLSPLQHNVSPATHLPRSPPSPGPVYGPQNKPQPNYPSAQDVRRSRRGSDSSSEGFREVRGAGEKWFIGGLTANGDERYYKLSMVKRDKSLDRISTDQMSL
ncbi:hypothetical protein CLAFUW4_03094 [Fulvia fulva]|uniref:Uncharacterized protein n=1 Tax=Passalora fulva TaxID=5499 RepID=A0A9Q8LAH8_PASFU|nr:uncharacterized protein CLAFUR5_03078 [Fulvia fulva]KAK4631835.1 hypothetical protein CLAFUR4_03087 [Fulvia fulva]KAK4632440.1 hypothetical protein CLAFUR0_03090 [Fulvia fulva]UJO13178.1 hypothetical protein CLAFUR5_03078 [Fulvia fulva]WPV11868.1 hypothetical protein CLAFUW4_03094 [Fulvia fulva]WPV26521.1 hypothetical protein CLAFUW7_03091 [Fulvia fulva]